MGNEGPRKDYRWAGVDIDAASRAVELIKEKAGPTSRPEVLSGVGGFSSLFELDLSRHEKPVLVSGTDGVGTKLKLAQMLDKHDTVGIDLVAMCADDVVACGAEPLFFQDYISTGKVEPDRIAEIVGGIADGCKKAGCSLVGGEVAEHPGVMEPEEYDLAGFCVGVVERDQIIDGSGVKPEDRVIGIASSGLHANGFSLVRKLLFDSGEFNLDDKIKELAYPLGRELLTPSFIYAPGVLKVAQDCDLKAIAHVTGGGITDNLPRVLPDNVNAEIHLGSWPVKNVFTFIQRVGEIDLFEMFRTFNMGLGMLLVVGPTGVRKALKVLDMNLYRAYQVGEIVEGEGHVRYQQGG
ncbi:MAG: phosphoribosylformylglycinamidine cyclo-ligase [Actinobacteria bacterium]|nr:phosphoribosylformylglycinamidine cyclo-ligase [Actinomycetota bacterium]MCG2796658.1 phosphoribosylformylglycinamidine cyclo-ligase [Actinomycetes bacterium]MBU4241303.1 phosphoribosylformylglycinamidine cyclo-ligase [Actinomycetota bacterium]MBU4302107.1 phosphoribosylformylglycinamidine cyclo-ligase [Actinomycetota bacterium]MBU4386392.1 phosphoribosylformylglycinamidine cyclo-ligase [Actinomycetota bacterium]